MMVEVNIEGLDEVQEKLKRLGNPRLIKNAANRSIRKAMRIVVQAARDNAKRIDDPETREMIHKNITYQQGRWKSVNWASGRVGVMGGAASNRHSKEVIFKEKKRKGEARQTVGENQVALPGGNTKHFRFIEFGTSEMPATPFLRPALQNNIQAVTNSFAENFNKEIDKELAKL